MTTRETPTGTWTYSPEFKHGTRTIKAGTILSIKNLRGRWRLVQHVQTPVAEWIDIVEIFLTGQSKKEPIRAVRADRVTRVHRTKASV
ncbi:DUF7246 family protein [Fodinicola feengrottensis]|uniref:DUF7246 domain-containing protein n=1 Tax=Fodinicola feengrottensis TaxID=435914 RepID=A0ABP4UDH7_9ACTN|nr:hypothetical protein [Fodinicola feengrottensis]